MSGIPWESEESQNYIRADYIVNNAVKKELRKFFIREWNKRYKAFAEPRPWDDTGVSGNHLYNKEYRRERPNWNMLQTKFKHGDTNKWDCTVFFDAILYSYSIGASLTTTQYTAIDNLREIRNKLAHDLEKKLSRAGFQRLTKNVENALGKLGLSSSEVTRIKNLFASFEVLPPKPTHEVVSRSDKIREDLEKLRSDNDGKLTYFYISGNPGSGKSQLARQFFEDICKDAPVKAEAMFVMTLNGKDLDSLLYSYEEFCRLLNCEESVLKYLFSSSKPKHEKIKDLKFQVTRKIKNWKKWWIIVDNVENLELIAPLLPLMGGDVWNNGQIIVTTQNTNAVPSDNLSSKHISLSHGMNKEECCQLLALLSRADGSDSLLDEVAEKLDRQPLAMASAAVYMRQAREIDSSFSWVDCLKKFEKDERESAEECLKRMNSAAYSSTMSKAVLLAVMKCGEKGKNLKHAFNLFSWISFEPLPRTLVEIYMQQQEEELDAVEIFLEMKYCSLFLSLGNEEPDIRLHRVVHKAVKIFLRPEGGEYVETERNDWKSEIYNVLQTMYDFKDRKDKNKLIPHLKAFTSEINKQFPNDGFYIETANLISYMYNSVFCET